MGLFDLGSAQTSPDVHPRSKLTNCPEQQQPKYLLGPLAVGRRQKRIGLRPPYFSPKGHTFLQSRGALSGRLLAFGVLVVLRFPGHGSVKLKNKGRH